MSKIDPRQLIDQIWTRAYLDDKEYHVKLLNEYASQAVTDYKEKLTRALVNKGFKNDDYNGKLLFDLIDKL